MHVPDGFLDAPTSVATGVVAVGRRRHRAARARRELDDRTAPLAGLVATFVFATQMLNFPVGSGTSGHLLGGALAAVLVGPATALLCMSVVFLVQSLLFADGGITALGTNIVADGHRHGGRRLGGVPGRPDGAAQPGLDRSRRRPRSARWCRCRSAALGVRRPVRRRRRRSTSRWASLAAAMVGVHTLIGIGEAVITFLAVGSIAAVRPDLVYGARPVLANRTLELRAAAR